MILLAIPPSTVRRVSSELTINSERESRGGDVCAELENFSFLETTKPGASKALPSMPSENNRPHRTKLTQVFDQRRDETIDQLTDKFAPNPNTSCCGGTVQRLAPSRVRKIFLAPHTREPTV